MRYVLLLCLCTATYSLTLTNSHVSQANRVNELALQCKFDSALVLCDSLVSSDSSNLFYAYLSLATLGLHSLDYMMLQQPNKVDTLLARGDSLFTSQGVVDSSPDFMRLWAFWEITAASFEAFDKHYFSAYNQGKSGLKRLYAYLDSVGTLQYDAFYYLGNEGYLKNEIRRRSGGFLFWFKKSGENGLSHLELSTDSASFMALSSSFSLVDYARSLKKITYANEILSLIPKKYHMSRFYLWPQLRLSLEENEQTKTVKIYMQLAQSYEKDGVIHASLACINEAIAYFDTTVPDELRSIVASIGNRKDLLANDESRLNKILKKLEKIDGSNK